MYVSIVFSTDPVDYLQVFVLTIRTVVRIMGTQTTNGGNWGMETNWKNEIIHLLDSVNDERVLVRIYKIILRSVMTTEVGKVGKS